MACRASQNRQTGGLPHVSEFKAKAKWSVASATLFIAQGLDGGELRRFPRGIKTGDRANGGWLGRRVTFVKIPLLLLPMILTHQIPETEYP